MAVGWKVLNLVTGIAARKASAKVTTKTWKAATGAPPKSQFDPFASAAELTIFAIFSAAVSAGIKTFIEQKSADYYTKTTGHEPPQILKARAEAEDKAEAQRRVANS